MPENQRMKGLYIMPNAETLQFLFDCLEDLMGNGALPEDNGGAWDDDVCDENPVRILNALESIGWIRVKDKFADKAYRTMHYPASTPPLASDELRFTMLLKKDGSMHLDLRPWGQYG